MIHLLQKHQELHNLNLKTNSSSKANQREKAAAQDAKIKSETKIDPAIAKKARQDKLTQEKAAAEVSKDDADGEQYSAVVVQFIDKNLKKAIKEGVSDIHFEVFKHTARMRFRLDGVLREEPGTDKILYENYSKIITRIKIMSRLDIAERRKAQDGAITLKVGEKEVDFRVSCMPTSFGERVVMRILDTDGIDLSIEKLGFHEDDEKAFIDAIKSPQGMVLVTGPTGSGKSTTLYAALNEINKEDINILTAEDPVEFTLDGVGQVHVKPDYGMTFATALRSFLRQDPEVVMVGESVGFSAEEATRVTLFHGEGCSNCNETGYKGRKGVYEVLRISDNLIEGILQEKTTPELKKIALEKDDFLNMQELGRTFLKDGSICIEEYKRILILD